MVRVSMGFLVSVVVVAATGCSDGASSAAIAYTGEATSDIVAAVKNGDTAMVEQSLNGDPALLETRDANGWTLLHVATLSNQPDVMALLMQKGMDPNVRDASGATPLAALEANGIRAEAARKLILEKGGISGS